MRKSGLSRRFVEQVCARVARNGYKGMFAIDGAARVLGRLFPVADSPKLSRLEGGVRVIALVGPTGVGKTTTLAKLGLRLLQAGRRMAFATLDTYRVGAEDQLRTYAELLETPLFVAADAAELADAIVRQRGSEVILLDTTGRSPRDANNLEQLARDVACAGEPAVLDTYLVLSSTTAARSFDAAYAAFRVTRPGGLVLTKLDESAAPGAALERALPTRLGIAFLCDGQDVTGHLHRPRPDHFADLCLRGRIV